VSENRPLGFLVYALWVIATLVLAAVWTSLGSAVLALIDELFVHSSGPNSTPLGIAYAGLVFGAFLWPAALVALTWRKQPLGRMMRSLLIALSTLELLLALYIALTPGASEPRYGFSVVMFGRELTSATDAMVTGLLTIAAVVLVNWLFSRSRTRPAASVSASV